MSEGWSLACRVAQPKRQITELSYSAGCFTQGFNLGTGCDTFAKRYTHSSPAMNLPVTRYPDGFTLAYLPDEHLLIGRWLRPVSLTELQAHYADLLQAALAHGHCRHWLLDVRRRPINDAAIKQWFGEEFGPRLPGVLGQPVVIAYFAMVGQEVAATDPVLGENIRQGSLHGAMYRYFDQEGAAMTWLAQQP